MQSPSMPPGQQLAQMASAYWVSQAIYVAAKLDLAELLATGPKSAEELSATTGTNAPSLYRLLRALASVGVFAEEADRTFRLTPLAEPLRTSHPGSQRALIVMTGEEHYRAYGELLYSVQTGRPGFEKIYGQPIFDYLGQRPEQAELFDAAMVSIHGRETQAMIEAYDFSQFAALADLGGGNGSLLTAVLQRHSRLKGILFDLPHVVERARPNLAAAGLAERCQCVSGSFFETAPPGADAYLMRHIIHDWNDEQCLTILRNIHRAAPAHANLLLIESVIQPGNEPSFAKLLDLTMLVIPGGKERTEAEYRTLFSAGGFELKRIVPTAAEISVLEAAKVTR
jgi:hypothetical protein